MVVEVGGVELVVQQQQQQRVSSSTSEGVVVRCTVLGSKQLWSKGYRDRLCSHR